MAASKLVSDKAYCCDKKQYAVFVILAYSYMTLQFTAAKVIMTL